MLPTKSNLIKLKKTIGLSKQGQELLEKKKYILIKEKEKYILEREKLKEQYIEVYNLAFNSLRDANVDLGIRKVKAISNEIQIDNNLEIKYKTVMGVDIPITLYKEEASSIPFGLLETSISLDNAIANFRKLKETMIKIIENTTTINRLEFAIQKVQKRSNSLKDVIIPNYEIERKSIENILDEKDREEFIRFKLIKSSYNS